jgi:integrase
VSKAKVGQEFDKIAKNNGPVAANRARATLSAFFVWAFKKDRVKINPVFGTEKKKEKSRNRVLSDKELAAIWMAADVDTEYGKIVRLLMLTGCRRDEIGSLRWSEVDLKEKTITLPEHRTKNGHAHTLPLTSRAFNILEKTDRRSERDLIFGAREGGYSGWSKSKAELDKVAKVKNWVLHDLRRSVASHMAEHLDIDPHIIEATLNHQSGHKSGVAGVYNRAKYQRPIKDALEKWDHYIGVIVAKANGANVTPLRKA